MGPSQVAPYLVGFRLPSLHETKLLGPAGVPEAATIWTTRVPVPSCGLFKEIWSSFKTKSAVSLCSQIPVNSLFSLHPSHIGPHGQRPEDLLTGTDNVRGSKVPI